MAILGTGQEAFTYVQAVPGTIVAPCGNGLLEPGEQCDDGNRVSGDCCNASCELAQPGMACTDLNACTSPDSCSASGNCSGPTISCDDGNICTLDTCDAVLGCGHTPTCNPTPTATPTETPTP